ncbi:hypothetical protein [Pseudanabaena mucicola]|nr:hypothetical protein [Pseudanabaena mucicola]
MASTALSQRWLSAVEAIGNLINRKSLTTNGKEGRFMTYPLLAI